MHTEAEFQLLLHQAGVTPSIDFLFKSHTVSLDFKMVLLFRNSVNYLNYSNSLLFLMPFLMIFTSA